MGTEIQSKTYFLGSNLMPNLNNSAANGMWALYYEDKTLNNGQHFDSSLTRQTGYGYFGYEKEQVRQTILKQESIFKHQLQELHRLYRRQRELMNEFRSRELMTSKSTHLVDSRTVQSPFCSIKGKNTCSPFQTRTFDLELPADAFIKNECKQQEEIICGASVPSDNGYLKRTHKLADLNEPICLEEEEMHMQNVYANSNSGFLIIPKEFSQSSPVVKDGVFFPNESERINEKELTYNFKAGKTKCDDCEPLTCFQSNQSKTEPQRKRRIFGIEISEGNPNPSIDASSATPILNPLNFESPSLVIVNTNSRSVPSLRDEVLNSSDCADLKSADGEKKHENPVRGLPWLMAKPHCREEEIKEKENSYQMSLDSLQNYSPQFFKKVELTTSPPRVSVHESDQREVEIGDDFSRNIFGFPIVDTAHKNKAPKSNADSCEKDSESEKLNYISGLRNQVDLNLSLNEEETPSVLSLPKAILKIASTEIDLEAPLVLECETDVSPQAESSLQESRDPHEEFDRVAAEALIAISSSQPLESSSNDCLLWFADIVSSHSGSHKLGQLLTAINDTCEQDEESIPEGMDYFELMTLKLKQDPKEEYLYEPQNEGEKTADASLPKRPRRGQARKGRQRKDFQRDVLPGLVSLSRHEVREDLETIEDICRASGSTWESSLSKRNAGKNRKKCAASKVCSASSPLQRLTGWGRRLPRQRCPAATRNCTRGLK